MLGTTGTFTSCKDYDDDITNLQTQITANADAIKKLQDLVGQGKWVTSVVGIENGIKVTMNDGTTADIMGINGKDGKDGQDGKDGKAGTVVTIDDGFWAFDGVKSEYPAVPGSASEAHEIQISEDGYWMIWDTEKGAYETTTYAVAPVSAAQNSNGSWTITVKNADGTTSSINIPATALASIEVDSSIEKDMTYWYGVVNQDVKWGWNNEETMNAGFYSKLNQDLLVLLNPAGVHGDSYAYTLKNSDGDEAPVTFFKTAVPYTGAALTKATSSNGLWVLPAEITVKPATDIEALRRELYLSFKVNDGEAYRLALEAADEQGNTVRTEYDNTVTLGAATAKKGTQAVTYEKNCLIGKTYYPEFLGEYGSQIYKYKMRLNQDPTNLRRAEVYGATVTEDGQGYLATKEAGIFNHIVYDICGVYINGTTFTATIEVWFTNEMTTDHSWTIEAISKKPLDAAQVVDLSTIDNYITSQLTGAKDLFAYTYTYNLTEKIAELSDTEKLVWNETIAKANIKSLRDDQELYINGLIGGEGENNATNRNELMNKHMSWSINPTTNVLTVTFYVSPDWAVIGTTPAGSSTAITAQDANFKLNNAYQLTLYVVDPENPTMNVAEIVLPFEFTQPTLEIEEITTTLNDQSKWTVWSGTTALTSYGAYGAATKDEATPVEMYLPMYEAFDAWATKYTAHKDQAKYYWLKQVGNNDVTFLGDEDKLPPAGTGRGSDVSLYPDLQYTSTWTDWNTYADDASVRGNNVEKKVPVDARFHHYGVYPEPKVTGFTLTFASLLKHSTLKMAAGKESLKVNTGTHDVFISNDDLDLRTPKEIGEGKFFLFDGLDGNEAVVARKTLNETSFNEEQRGFMTVDEILTQVPTLFHANAKENPSVTYNFTYAGEVKWTIDPQTGKRTYKVEAPDGTNIKIYKVPAMPKVKDKDGYVLDPTHTMIGGHTGGIVIQLPTTVADQHEVLITMNVRDYLGFTNDLTFTVKKIK